MWYDVVCVVILLLSIWRGLIKGFLWQLATIAGLVLCFFFAETVSLAVAPMIGLDPPLNRWVSILGLYVVGSFVAFAMARTIRGGLEKAKFDDYDRHLGAIFGGVKGVTLCLLLSFFMFTLSENTRETVMHSQSGYASAMVFHHIEPAMPEELHTLILPYLKGFDPDSIAQHRKDHPIGSDHDHDDHSGHNHDDDDDYGFPGGNPGQPGGQSPFPFPYPSNPSTGAPNPFGEYPGPGTAQPISQTKPSPTVEDWMKQIPGLFGTNMQDVVYEAIRQTDPKHRQELIEKLNTGMPGLMRQVAEEWSQGKPAETTMPPVPAKENWKQHRAQMLREIAGVYTEHLDAQQSIMEEVVYSLSGIPDAVTVAVLEDWHADLLRNRPDPDPTTDMTSALDQRIVNQLAKARVSVNSLSREVQDRLAVALRGYR